MMIRVINFSGHGHHDIMMVTGIVMTMMCRCRSSESEAGPVPGAGCRNSESEARVGSDSEST